MEQRTPLIVNITHNSLDDGPGIRSVLFFKGCTLYCVFCQNPETQNPNAELFFQPGLCIKCQPCQIKCPQNAANFKETIEFDRNRCEQAWNCTSQCPADVFKKVGIAYELEDLVRLFSSYKVFYENTQGGVTLSGGEPLFFPAYVENLTERLQQEHIHFGIETCGNYLMSLERLKILQRADFIYYDIKIWDSDQHKKYCGVSNEIILQNFQQLINNNIVSIPENLNNLHWKTNPSDKPYLIPRIPLIPGITDPTDNLRAIAEYWRQFKINIIDLLPYNPLWLDKKKKLNQIPSYSHKEWMKPNHLANVKQFFSGFQFERFK